MFEKWATTCTLHEHVSYNLNRLRIGKIERFFSSISRIMKALYHQTRLLNPSYLNYSYGFSTNGDESVFISSVFNPRRFEIQNGRVYDFLKNEKLFHHGRKTIKKGKKEFKVHASQYLEEKPDIGKREAIIGKCINSIRILVVDSVNNAKAGHPGAAMGLAALGFVLFNETMNFNPNNSKWFNRDRFILSAGHACLLQYVLLHLTGYGLQIDDLKKLTRFGSRTPGHPENTVTPGIELTTGPLGQGFANAVGLALAEKHLASRFNKPDAILVDHYTYVILGDGCVMEGVTNEAASLAGHWGLGKLIAFYDDNQNTIDGSIDLALSENVCLRYESLGWHVLSVSVNHYDHLDILRQAISEAKSVTDKPSLIKVRTKIGYGSPSKEGTAKAHHGAFGSEEAHHIRERLNWKCEEAFSVPEEVYKEMRNSVEKGRQVENEWNEKFKFYSQKYPSDAKTFQLFLSNQLPENWEEAIPEWNTSDAPDATRGYSEKVLNCIAEKLPSLIGGSADLASSTKTYIRSSDDFQKSNPVGRNIRYGVREHAMGSISNGIAMHDSGLIPFAATFLVFTDYMRPAVRLSALEHAQVLWIGTHDSIGLGEDGPTHQPIEHLASLRAIPNLHVFRPGDGNETSGAYLAAISRRSGPSLLALSRQKLDAHLEGSSISGVSKGGYILSENSDAESLPDLIILSTGSELPLCEKAAKQLRQEHKIRVVSMVCWELFEQQSQEYRESVLPPTVKKRISVEAGSPQGWREWVGDEGKVISVNRFGASGAYLEVFEAFGFTVDNVIQNCKRLLASGA